MELAETARCLRSLDPTAAILALRAWCADTPISIIRATLARQSPHDRDALATACFDILSTYPTIRFASPVLLYFRADDVCVAKPPVPTVGSWIGLRRVVEPSARIGNTLFANRIQSALVEVLSPDTEAPALPADWLQSMTGMPAVSALHMSAGPLLPWPAAVEAAQIAHSSAVMGRDETDSKNVFLADQHWHEAVSRARLFRSSIVRTGETR